MHMRSRMRRSRWESPCKCGLIQIDKRAREDAAAMADAVACALEVAAVAKACAAACAYSVFRLGFPAAQDNTSFDSRGLGYTCHGKKNQAIPASRVTCKHT